VAGVAIRRRSRRADGRRLIVLRTGTRASSRTVQHHRDISFLTAVPPAAHTAVVVAGASAVPAWLSSCLTAVAARQAVAEHGDEAVAIVMRSRPRVVVLDARGERAHRDAMLATCRRLKEDPYSGIVPVVLLLTAGGLPEGFAAGADEVLLDGIDAAEGEARLEALVRRSDRDTDVHPSSRLPGARAIEAEVRRRIGSGERFAACYADLDHFKEYNDRYGFQQGDRVIRVLARILHDVVSGLCGAGGFVGHIGGDDFLFMVPLARMPQVCDEIVRVFDELVPLQYSEQDRRVGYFFGKDRRGQLHRVPLMSLSIGVVTNQRRRFEGAAQVSDLATEMKSFAKTKSGSLWVVDRRSDEPEAPVRVASDAVPPGATRRSGTDR
jgi:diguanylate cyclase (GGDEF)-like protein